MGESRKLVSTDLAKYESMHFESMFLEGIPVGSHMRTVLVWTIEAEEEKRFLHLTTR